jgi:ferredoxin-NADP reductase
MGAFVLPKDPTIPAVLIAGGVGVAPYRSMVLSIGPNDQRNIALIYAARTPQELIFTDVFHAAPITFTPVISSPDPIWSGETGHLTGQRILDLLDPQIHKSALYYLSGPEAMFTDLRRQLLEAGIDSSQIVLDYYPGYTEL